MANYLVQNADLRRFCDRANKLYFGGRLPIAKISFSSKLKAKNWHGRCYVQVYERAWVSASGLPPQVIEEEMHHIEIGTHLRRSRDFCMMTVYHEMVHAELDMIGLRGKDLKCRKSSVHFNRRMAELAQAGAFNGLW